MYQFSTFIKEGPILSQTLGEWEVYQDYVGEYHLICFAKHGNELEATACMIKKFFFKANGKSK